MVRLKLPRLGGLHMPRLRGIRLPAGRGRTVVAVIVGAVVIAAVVVPWTLSGAGASQGNTVVILAKVQPRTLQDTVQLTGTLARKSLSTVTAFAAGLVTGVNATDGQNETSGQTLFALNGRDAVAEPGSIPFFRSLALGDAGPDVLELKQILAAAGDYPGSLTDDQFTEQTQFALAQWQAQHDYPNATPATTETVNVALQQGSGYQIGAQASAGLTIGPPAAQTSAAHTGTTPTGVLLAYPRVTTPTLTIQSVADQVPQGEPADFVVTANPAPSADLPVNLDFGGTAGSNDIITPPSTVTILSGTTSAEVTVDTRVNTTVEAEPTVVATIASGTGYDLGSPDTAQTTITNDNTPQLEISGGATVSPGGSATLTITANQAPIQATQVLLSLGGSAQAGTDYTPPDPVVTLPAGATTASVTVNTLSTDAIGPNKFVVVSLAPSPGSYTVGTPGSAVVTIAENQNAPVVTLTSPATVVTKGQPYQVSVNLSAPMTTPLTVSLSYGGSAVAGTDYTPPAGPIVVPPGQSSFPVAIPTIADNVVEANRTLTVSLAPSAAYQTGSASSVSVTIKSAVLPTLTLSASTSSITEGGAASFTITADQAPTMDTSINFAVQGTAQPGADYEPILGVALLKAGQTRVTVTLQSIEKDVTFEPTDMVVATWPTTVGDVYVKSGNPVTAGEDILDLTEPQVSVTLQASPSDRTNLAVGQQCTVQVSGGTAQVSGTITELDAAPTTISSGGAAAAAGGGGGSSQEVYEGTISSSDLASLNGADGSTVSITVTDQQVTNAPSVPIAAVKQNGVGTDVVRVLGSSGSVTEVPVTTGLSEGSYIQIKSGVSIGETVIVQSDQS
ncbi:MAG: Calx-beta domain-containing protein [Acidimicrobiales bacterium]|jgi:biotin carboxyl carrier protein